jgi:ATP-dependent DNA helicase DinG
MIDLDDIFKADGRLAAGLTNFEPRDGQRAMAEAVASVLCSSLAGEYADSSAKIVVVEAETGIGKTLAYLIPAIFSGKRVVVSTATLNLQDQIIDKDIPLLARILGQDIPALCLKGRQNYLCLYRWYQYRSNPQLSLFAEPWVERIDAWLQNTATGDRAELAWLGEKSGLWPKVSCHSNQCFGGDCPESTGCFINQLRKQAGSCRLIVVNHHLFFSDLALRKAGFGEVLPRYDAVIFDEAHHLENVASTFFGKSFSHYQLIDLLGDIELQVKDHRPEVVERLLPLQSGLKERADAFAQFFPLNVGRFHLEQLIEELSRDRWREEIELLSTGILRLIDCLKTFEAEGEGWLHLAGRAHELNCTLREFGLFEGSINQEYVYWYEKRERSVTLSATPIKVAEELRKHLYASVNSCVLTSATLSSGGSFAYIKERLGLDDAVECRQFHSPFDYESRTLLYIPETGFSEPAAEGFLNAVCARILDILRLSEGRALVLCTSYKGMDALTAFLGIKLDYPILVQGTASRNSLLRSFREETHSVLLATASFWEGVDVVGEALSCVIIDKLPFEVPSDPVIQARISRTKDEGGNPFFDFQVPRAILALRQGFGRLMRSSADRGVIAIMDVRLFTKGYGRTFLKSLPASPITRDLADIATFFRAADTVDR